MALIYMNGTSQNMINFDTLLLGLSTGKSLTTASSGGHCIIGSHSAINLNDSTSNNTIIGNETCNGLISGSSNVAIGYSVSTSFSGSHNVVIGVSAGSAYVLGESSNILINSAGVAAESNTIRIGIAGSGTGQQNRCFVAGITGVTPAGGGIQMTVVDTSGQLGSQAIPAASLTWSEVTGTTQAMAVGNGYLLNNAGAVTATLPASATVGQRVAIVGSGAGGWILAQNSGQTIHFGAVNSTTGVGGSLSSNNRYDSVELICNVTNTDWVVRSSVGSIIVT